MIQMRKRGGQIKWKKHDKIRHKTAICEWIGLGKTLRDYCRQEKTPSFVVIYRWLDEDDDFAERFAHARKAGHDRIADEALALADETPATMIEVQWRRLQVDTRLKLLAKWYPQKYSERLTHDGASGGVNLVVMTGVPQPIALSATPVQPPMLENNGK